MAPWIEPADPVSQLAGRTVLIAHGDRDQWTDPARSYEYARRARLVTPRVCRFEVRGAGHAMLHRSADWTGLVRAFVADELGVSVPHPAIVVALCAADLDGLRRPLPSVCGEVSRTAGRLRCPVWTVITVHRISYPDGPSADGVGGRGTPGASA